jgi:hypothetical protein
MDLYLNRCTSVTLLYSGSGDRNENGIYTSPMSLSPSSTGSGSRLGPNNSIANIKVGIAPYEVTANPRGTEICGELW